VYNSVGRQESTNGVLYPVARKERNVSCIYIYIYLHTSSCVSCLYKLLHTYASRQDLSRSDTNRNLKS